MIMIGMMIEGVDYNNNYDILTYDDDDVN